MADTEQHRATLDELNRNYITSVDEADVAWFDANLMLARATRSPTVATVPAATPMIGSYVMVAGDAFRPTS